MNKIRVIDNRNQLSAGVAMVSFMLIDGCPDSQNYLVTKKKKKTIS